MAAITPRSKPQPLPPEFFNRDPRRVARDLLGKLVIRRQGRQILSARIVETEAYLGQNDPAAHSSSGRTPRNEVIFGPPGHAYVYFIYGNHYCLNVSCLPDGKAGGVLFRAVEPVTGTGVMAENRGVVSSHSLLAPADLHRLTNGPGKLCEAMNITRSQHNGLNLTEPTQTLWLGDDDHPKPRVQTTPRIGITKAADLKLRYIVSGNPFVSKSPKLLPSPKNT